MMDWESMDEKKVNKVYSLGKRRRKEVREVKKFQMTTEFAGICWETLPMNEMSTWTSKFIHLVYNQADKHKCFYYYWVKTQVEMTEEENLLIFVI